ncbi:Aste57867_3181 [Aphanomyces stellatus]|uniref:Aste57867_3181 protein n=1 Tax=Aphanomyces stellatus TaxID=120398 RepID=A0A485KDG8_9STRA|nr:hypothetical protein As57867_003172 [Aphanomyces stellatus]VFT80355.1 Aste57867_3181 [Aphanomyces stellatus]
MEGTVWNLNIGDDVFDFLPPVNEFLFESSVDGPLPSNDVSDETTSPTQHPERPRRKKRTNTLQVQLLSLHEDKAELERQLMELERRREGRLQTLSASALKWEQLARGQLHLKLKALRENEHLRATIHEQSTLQRELAEIVLKKPRLMMMKMEDDQWRVLKLSGHGEKRLNAIHAIADRQFESIDSEMLRLGLVDTTDDVWHVRTATSHDGIIYGEGMRCTLLLDASLDAVLDAAWKTLLDVHVQPQTSTVVGAFKSYSIDADTLYVRTTFRSPDGHVKAEMSMIMKKQVVGDDGRATRVVFRTVLDDEAHPFEAESYVSDQYGWMHMESESSDGTAVRYKSYIRSNLMDTKREDVDELVDLASALHLDGGYGLTRTTTTKDDPAGAMRHIFDAAFRAFEAPFLRYLTQSKTST